MIAFTGFWLAPEASERKKLLGECWRLAKEALKGLDETGSALEYGETYNRLSSSAAERYCYESSFEFRDELVREAVQYGDRAIILLSNVNALHELTKAYVRTAIYLSVSAMYLASDMDEKDDYYRKGREYWQKATELSEETAYVELLNMPGEPLDWSIDEILVQFGKALGYARKTKDKYLLGAALENLKYATGWTVQALEDPDKKERSLKKFCNTPKTSSISFQ